MRCSRLFALLAAIPLIVPAAGTAGAAPPIKIGIAYDAAGLGDLSINDMARQGALQAAAEYPIRLIEMQLASSGRLSDPAVVLGRLAKRADLVVAVGFTYQAAADAAAVAYPGTNFVVLDGVPDVDPIPSNLLGTTVAHNEGSFLVGAAAANESVSGQIGFIGGVEIPVIIEFQAGFGAGVGYQDTSATVAAEYVSSFPDFSGFNDPARAYDMATAMYRNGVDVIYHAAGGSGIGVFAAARDYSQVNDQVWAIGVDTDQYLTVDDDLKPYILTSMVKRIDVMAYDVIAMQATGTFPGGTVEQWDVSRDGVDYATSGGFIANSVSTLEDIKQFIIDGTITVPTTL